MIFRCWQNKRGVLLQWHNCRNPNHVLWLHANYDKTIPGTRHLHNRAVHHACFFSFFFLLKVPNPKIILRCRMSAAQQDVFRPPYQTTSATVSKLHPATSNKKKKTQTQTTVVHDPHDRPFARLATRQNHHNVALSFGLFESAVVRQNLHSCPSLLQVVYPLTGSDTLCRKKTKKSIIQFNNSQPISRQSPRDSK